MAGTGRRPVIDAQKRTFILSALRNGVPDSVACAAVGVNLSTYYVYLTKGRKDAARGKETHYASFFNQVQAAKAVGEMELVKVIRESAVQRGDVGSSKWLLERRYPKRWAPRQQLAVTKSLDDNAGPVEFVLHTPKPIADIEQEDAAHGESGSDQ